MRTALLLKRNLAYYWQTNLVVVLGVAIAVAVLAGALLIGESVRGSLRDLFSQRLGRTDDIISSTGFFRERLAADLVNQEKFASNGFAAACPMIALDGILVHEQSRRRAGKVKVYGVDERFWSFHGLKTDPLNNRESWVSESLSHELGSSPGDALVLRIENPSEVPVESLHGRKDDVGRTIRLNEKNSLPASLLGEFSVQPQQGAARAVFVSLSFLQKELGQEGKVNTILVSERSSRPHVGPTGLQTLLGTPLNAVATLEDLGLKLRTLNNQQIISLESESKIISDNVAEAARTTATSLSLRPVPVLSYLANSISSGERSTPYSLVTALDDDTFQQLKIPERQRTTGPSQGVHPPPIILNEWIARDLQVRPGDTVSLEYYLWLENGRLETKRAQFQLVAVVPIAGLAADRDLVPEYAGITQVKNLSDWDPPFPIDLDRIRKQDEDYWHQYRTTPKAFIPLSTGQELWQSRFGKLTSVRIEASEGQISPEVLSAYQNKLREALSRSLVGFQLVPVREQGLLASRGATDFGEYFLYFSFFLVVSALLLTALFFKLGIEQRLREIGILEALGFATSRIRKIFLTEGILLAIAGSLIGLLGAIAYAELLMYGLRTWWLDAVGTTLISLHISWQSLIVGAAGGVLAAVICIFFTLRRLGRTSTRSLLTGTVEEETPGRADAAEFRDSRRRISTSPLLSLRRSSTFTIALALTIIGLSLLFAGFAAVISQVAGFFGGGVVLLIAGVCYIASWLRRRSRKAIHGSGLWAISRMGFRNTTYRPVRTVLCITLIASAAFIIVAVDAFRRSGSAATDRKSGSGGFALLAESLLPIVNDANTAEGGDALNLTNTNDARILKDVTFTSFRVRPGDDTSCLNLYQPRNPKIIAPPDTFIRENRFTFQSSLASSVEEKENPWLILNHEFEDGAIPVISDANSLSYVLHLKLGEEFELAQSDGQLRLRVVGALADSIFQSELLMSERNFLRLFPEQEGYRFFLIATPTQQSTELATVLEERLSDFGFDTVATNERLANFHRVENTYLSTFQMLGGLGLVLGTLGMAAVLLRNVFERRRELALLRAVGYNSSHFAVMVITENVLMLCYGLAIGFICALLSIAPVLFERGVRLPNISLGLLLLAVLVSGGMASLVATLAALRSPLLPALRAE